MATAVALALSVRVVSIRQHLMQHIPASFLHYVLEQLRVRLGCVQPLHAYQAQLHACTHVMTALTLLCWCCCVQVTDGAAAVLLMTRREALNRGLPVLGIFRSFAAVGVDPAIMGVGPAVAIPAAVEQVGSCGVIADPWSVNTCGAAAGGTSQQRAAVLCRKECPVFVECTTACIESRAASRGMPCCPCPDCLDVWVVLPLGLVLPACLLPRLLLQAGLTLDDIDVYEINEAFASQATYSVQKLGLDQSKVREDKGSQAACMRGFRPLRLEEQSGSC